MNANYRFTACAAAGIALAFALALPAAAQGKDDLWEVSSKMEMPGLVELRKAISPDKLVILAISREDPALLKSFVAQNSVNYTVLSSARATLVSPYADVQNIPSAFFIDPEGKIKLATMGMMPQADAVKILDAR